MDKNYSIQDLVDIDRLRALFENFSNATGFTTGFVSFPEQELLIATGWQDVCTKFHRVCPASAECCKESNIYLTTCLKNLNELSIKRCGNGLVDGATPVIIRGKHLASLATGQVLLAPPDLDFFKALASRYGYDTDEYLAALAKVPVVTESQLKNTLSFLSGLAVQIAEEGLSRLQIEETADHLRQSKRAVERQVRERTVELQKTNTQLQVELEERNRVDKALLQSETLLRAICETIPDPIFVKDLESRMILANPAVLRTVGKSAKEVLGKSNDEFFPDPESARMVMENDRRIMQSGTAAVLEEIFQTSNGVRVFLSTKVPYRDADGRIIGLIGVTRDITGRKLAEKALKKSHDELEERVRERTAELRAANAAISKSEASLRALSNNIPNGITYQLVRTEEGRSWFEYISAGIERLYGFPAELALANPRNIYKSFHPDDRDRILRVSSEAVRALRVCDVEGRVITPKGEVRWVNWRSSPRRLENGHTVSDGIAIDITARKRAEEALQRAHRTLQVLQACNKALVHASSEPELLDSACQILMDIWGARMTWVGFAEDDAKKTVRVAAHAGSDEGYLEKLRVTWADEPLGRGPVGTAIRTQQVNVCRNISTDPCFAPWREEAILRGYASMMTLPLISDNVCLGALIVYSSQGDAFNSEEVELLKQLAGDLTYGIISLRTREERYQLQNALLSISEREKQHIAQELHDGICQHLAGTAMTSKLLEHLLEKRGDSEAKYAKQIGDLLRTGLDEARNLSHGLHPVKDDPNGLSDALAQLSKTVTNLFCIRCFFRCASPVFVEKPATATHLFRIAQEAVNNAIKHGEASKVLIGLRYAEEGIVLSIRDNGVGIDDHTPSTGMGMQIMKHRAAAIGATVTIRRAEKHGTLVTCTLPFAL